jgi:hypothetical protein
MALASSGTISVSQINTELGRTSTSSNTSLTSLNTGAHVSLNSNSTSKPNSSTPHQMSEWYSYNHSASGTSYTSIVFYYYSSEEVDVDLQLYTDSDGSETAAGGYYKYVFSNSGWVVNEDGEISDSYSCGR